MALPADILASAAYPAVTNARASDDYHAGAPHSWKIGGTSLLLSAVDMKASKDNFWSGSSKTDRGQETSPFLSGVVTALSGGPVGFSDALMRTDPNVLWPTTTEDGTLLHLSRPATTVDRCFYAADELDGAEIRAGHAAVNGTSDMWYTVLAIELEKNLVSALSVSDLWPKPASSTSYNLWQWNNSACSADKGPGDACAAALQRDTMVAGAPTPARPSPDQVKWALWSAAPVLSNGYSFLGEKDKYVSVSPNRFKAVAAPGAGAGIEVALVGAPGEEVALVYIAPDKLTHLQTITVAADGKWTGVLP